MTRMLVTPTFVLTLVFAAALAFIHAQPFDDRGMRVLLSDDCAAPCFLGIRPGETSESAALALVRAHAWVASVSQKQTDFGYNTWYNLYWSGRQPRFIDADAPGVLYVQWINSSTTPLVYSIEIQTIDSLGGLYLKLGQPESVNVSPLFNNMIFSGLLIENVYESVRLTARSYLLCPLNIRRLADQRPFSLTFGYVHYYPDSYLHWMRLYRYPGC